MGHLRIFIFRGFQKAFFSTWFENILIFTLLLFAGALLFGGCENPITGYGPQPNFIDSHSHEPMLNIFGVLRPESQYGVPLSFVHLEGSFSVTSEYPDSFDVPDANVILFHYEGSTIIDSMELIYTNFDKADMEFEYRPVDFYPMAQYTYGISCRKEGYPELTSRTTVPPIPHIVENSLNISTDQLSFTISRDSLVALYDIYFQIGGREYSMRILRPEVGDIQVNLNYNRSSEQEGTLLIYAYDLKLSEYITTTIIMKPNTYQASYSTVENGYGSFGSLNVLEKTITF